MATILIHWWDFIQLGLAQVLCVAFVMATVSLLALTSLCLDYLTVCFLVAIHYLYPFYSFHALLKPFQGSVT